MYCDEYGVWDIVRKGGIFREIGNCHHRDDILYPECGHTKRLTENIRLRRKCVLPYIWGIFRHGSQFCDQ